MRRSALTATLTGVVVAGVVAASAATLGGLSGATLGADDAVVAGCDSDGVTVGYTTGYNSAEQTYEVSAVSFSGVAAACHAKSASVTLSDGTAALNTTEVASIDVAAGEFSVTLSAPVRASAVAGVSLVISG